MASWTVVKFRHQLNREKHPWFCKIDAKFVIHSWSYLFQTTNFTFCISKLSCKYVHDDVKELNLLKRSFWRIQDHDIWDTTIFHWEVTFVWLVTKELKDFFEREFVWPIVFFLGLSHMFMVKCAPSIGWFCSSCGLPKKVLASQSRHFASIFLCKKSWLLCRVVWCPVLDTGSHRPI